jgi:hypothetical protein
VKKTTLIASIIAFMAVSLILPMEGQSADQAKATGKGKAPAKLDKHAVGTKSSKATPLFDEVVRGGITEPGWTKTSEGEYAAPSGRKFKYDSETGKFEPSQGSKPDGSIPLPDDLKQQLANQAILGSLDYNSLGLSFDAKLTQKFTNGKLTEIINEATGKTLVKFEYDPKNGNLKYVVDLVNRMRVEYAATDSCAISECTIVGTTPPFSTTTRKTTVSNILGKVLNVYMTDDKGGILTGANSSCYYHYFADKAPLVPTNWGVEVTDRIWHDDAIKAVEVRYNADGSVKNIRYNTWTAGLWGGYYSPGLYAYRIDNFDAQGNKTTTWCNDPAPTRFEPTFTGTVEKDQYGRFFLKVTSVGAEDLKKTPTLQSKVGNTFLLTTRYSEAGGQPSSTRYEDLKTATAGGAAEFASVGWDSLIGQSVTLQGHLMTNPAKSEKGLYYKDEKIGVFSAFNVL